MVQRFEDLDVWQLARQFSREIIPLLRRCRSVRDDALWQQLNASALSTVANIAEGFVRGLHREFAQYVRIAAASNAEARALLHVARDRENLTVAEHDALVQTTERISQMLRRLLQHLQG